VRSSQFSSDRFAVDIALYIMIRERRTKRILDLILVV
jgi:hypothetical protein